MTQQKKALVVFGGWEGHQPRQVADIFARVLREAGFAVELSDTTDAFANADHLKSLSLIVPVWTMGKLEGEKSRNVLAAVASGVGMAGCHGGMCDAFRENTDWLFLTGGQFVGHPGNDGTRYTVKIGPTPHEITAGISDFTVSTEQYYLLVDPANQVLAYTEFPNAPGDYAVNGPVKMPVLWTRRWGKGRVFYNSLGHQATIVESEPCLTIMKHAFEWASR